MKRSSICCKVVVQQFLHWPLLLYWGVWFFFLIFGDYKELSYQIINHNWHVFWFFFLFFISTCFLSNWLMLIWQVEGTSSWILYKEVTMYLPSPFWTLRQLFVYTQETFVRNSMFHRLRVCEKWWVWIMISSNNFHLLIRSPVLS